jgi:hypothetical protein
MFFRLHARNHLGETKTFIYNQEFADLLDEKCGQEVCIPHAIHGEIDANSDQVGTSVESSIADLAEERNRLTDVSTPYLSSDWYNIRKLYADNRNISETIGIQSVDNVEPRFSAKTKDCAECVVARFCHGTPPHCRTSGQKAFAQLQVAVQRATGFLIYYAESLAGTYMGGNTYMGQKQVPVLYAPIDILDEVVPEVDPSRLYSWIESSLDVQQQALESIKASPNLSYVYDEGFTNTSDSAYVSMITHPETGEWFNGFAEAFPELTAYFSKFPVYKMRVIAVTSKPVVGSAKPINAYYHHDLDTNQLGIRFYAFKSDVKRLVFRKIRPELSEYYCNRVGRRQSIPNRHLSIKPVVANTLSGPHAWVLDRRYSAHAVNGFNLEPRCVFFFYGEVNMTRVEGMLKKSRIKYADNILLLTDL